MFRSLFEGAFCLICHEQIVSPFGWVDLFTRDKKEVICLSCQGKLQRIVGEICDICGRPFGTLESKYRMGERCYDCLRWEDDPDYQGLLTRNYSLYGYNEFLKEVIAKFKYRGDYVLVKIFADEIKMKLTEIKPDYIIPIPLSDERLYERGFNQAEALIAESGTKSSPILTRIHSEKQSKKSRTERIHIAQVFKANQNVTGKIILIDDIYTTGSTLRHAAKALKLAGAESVYSLTIARG
jgi:competence protein ComFC